MTLLWIDTPAILLCSASFCPSPLGTSWLKKQIIFWPHLAFLLCMVTKSRVLNAYSKVTILNPLVSFLVSPQDTYQFLYIPGIELNWKPLDYPITSLCLPICSYLVTFLLISPFYRIPFFLCILSEFSKRGLSDEFVCVTLSYFLYLKFSQAPLPGRHLFWWAMSPKLSSLTHLVLVGKYA